MEHTVNSCTTLGAGSSNAGLIGPGSGRPTPLAADGVAGVLAGMADQRRQVPGGRGWYSYPPPRRWAPDTFSPALIDQLCVVPAAAWGGLPMSGPGSGVAGVAIAG